MKRTTTIPFLLSISIAACSGQPDHDAVELVATACAISTDEAVALLAPHSATCDDKLDGACCSNPVTGCVPMEYPDTVCYALPAPPEATVLEKDSEVDTDVDTTTMYYENCPPEEGEPPPTCGAADSAFVLLADADTHWVARFLEDAEGNQYAELYPVPEGGGAVTIPDGGEVQPLLGADDPYADLDRGVPTPDGTLYVNKQLDCIPRAGGCGFTCWKC